MDIAMKKQSLFVPPPFNNHHHALDYPDLKPDAKDLESINAVLLDFSGVTTAHGIPRVITGKSTISKLFWLTMTLTSLGAFLWQGSLVLKDYSKFPYITQIDKITKTELKFPAVTVCNTNMMRRSAMVGTRFESLIDVDGGVKGGDAEYSWWFDWSSEWWKKYESAEESSMEISQIESAGEEISSPEGFSSGPTELPYTDPGTLFGAPYSGTPETNEPPISTESVSWTDTTPDEEPSQGSETSSDPPERKRRRRRQSPLRVIPDPITGKLQQPRQRKRQRRDAPPGESAEEDDAYEGYDWWDNSWEAEEFEYNNYDWNQYVTGEDDWLGYYERSKSPDFSDLLDVVNPTRDELREMGHQAEDFILQCTFDRKDCNFTNFHQFQNRYYGNCFTFNQLVDNTSHIRTTGKTGAQYGLHLTLFTEQPEYVGLFAQESGVRVSIHQPYINPFPEDDGVVASTGQATNIAMKQSFIKRLEKPHGNCSDGTNTNFTTDIQTYRAYTSRACVKSCVQQHLTQRCGCVTDIMSDGNICSPLNKTQQVCRQAIEQFFHDGKLECICPIACEETNYQTAVSTSLWPSERYEEHLKSRLTNDKADRILQNIEHTRKNLARVRIYFEELNYEQMIQDPKYTVESLFGALGGLLGLYIGLSLISVCELVVLVFDLVKFVSRKAFMRNKVMSLKSGQI